MLPPRPAFALALAVLAAGCFGGKAAVVEPHDHDMMDGHAGHAMGAVTKTMGGDLVFSASTPLRAANAGGAYAYPLRPDANVTGFVVEVEWTPASPATTSLSLWVRKAGDALDPSYAALAPPEPLAKTEGASPLRLAVPATSFPDLGAYDALVRAAGDPVGSAAAQPFTFHVTAFHMVPFDPEFTALGQA